MRDKGKTYNFYGEFLQQRILEFCLGLRFGFLPIHISKGVLGTFFEGTLFNMWTFISNYLVHKSLGKSVFASILCTMYIKVLFLPHIHHLLRNTHHGVLVKYPILFTKLKKRSRCLTNICVLPITHTTPIQYHYFFSGQDNFQLFPERF